VLCDEYEGIAYPYILPYSSIAINAYVWYSMLRRKATLEWDEEKDRENQAKQGIFFGLHNRLFLIPTVLLRKTLLIVPKKTGITAWDVSAKVS
jgi:hypothetical protein